MAANPRGAEAELQVDSGDRSLPHARQGAGATGKTHPIHALDMLISLGDAAAQRLWHHLPLRYGVHRFKYRSAPCALATGGRAHNSLAKEGFQRS